MEWRKEIWTWLLVTAMTALIWIWAAGETREERAINYARVEFAAPQSGSWVITPNSMNLKVRIEGSRNAIQKAERFLNEPLVLSVPPVEGTYVLDLTEQLREHQGLRQTGARITDSEPRTIALNLDKIAEVKAAVKAVLPGIKTEGEVVIEPAEITVAMPKSLQNGSSPLTVEAVVDRSELDQLEPGIQHTLEVRVRPPNGLSATDPMTLNPAKVRVSFVIRSRVREITLESVAVHVGTPYQDREGYLVEIEPQQLQNVVVSADEDLIRRIESGEVPVVGVVHLRTRDLEEKIKSKAVSYYMALVPQATGLTTFVPVTARADRGEMPRIRLKIVDRLNAQASEPDAS
ncbi:MAG: hypothetical protein L0219_12525 [Phycisphaerales bacterium]|nr:hypothetical protein [Phycisphaerales bacterium]